MMKHGQGSAVPAGEQSEQVKPPQRGLRALLNRIVWLDWLGPAITMAAVALCVFIEKRVPAIPHPDILLILAVAFGAFHRGTRVGLICALIAAADLLADGLIAVPTADADEIAIQLMTLVTIIPIAILAGRLRNRVLHLSQEALQAALRLNSRLEQALDRANAAERELAEVNALLEGRVARRTEQLQSTVENLKRSRRTLVATHEELKQAHRAGQDILHALDQHAAVAILDAENAIVSANDRMVELMGRSRESLLARMSEDKSDTPFGRCTPTAFWSEIRHKIAGG